jgi:dTMP kinase
MKKNFFISFEGIDGSGKDTQLIRLLELVRKDDNYPFGDKYSRVWVTREPTKITESGKKISSLIREREVSGEEATNLFVNDRKEHSKIIKKVLEFSHVFTSRYDLSTLSYQLSQGMDFNYLYNLHSYNDEEGTLIPHITLVFDLPVDVAFKRTSSRNEKIECFEKDNFQKKIRENLSFVIDELRKRDGRKIILINANQSVEDVTKEMCEKIAKEISSI